MPLFSQQRTHAAGAPLASPAPVGAAASHLLKRYRPLETRAAGGFGTVEICLDSRLQRRVAIKRIPLGSPNNRAAVEAIAAALREARTMSLLQHPNIVSVIDFTYDTGYAYLVMEYVDGVTLEEFLTAVDGHSLTFDEAACIADALVQALDCAHANGALHLDIKPANVLIDRSGHVTLTDFGMAKLTSAAGFGGARGGTIGYMPPEQLRSDRVDRRSDIFSLACVLYESLCGFAPFVAATPIDSMTLINEGVTPPDQLLRRMPEASNEALLCALDPDINNRMRTVADFGARFLANLGDPREGQRSLAAMIEQITSYENDASEPEPDEPDEPTWVYDPVEGHLGSRTPLARRRTAAAIAGVSVVIATFSVLETIGVASPFACLVAALAVGAAAATAPQIGSALAFTGLLFMVLDATPLVAALPACMIFVALTGAWWIVWGRSYPAASSILVALLATALALRDPVLLAPAVAAAAGYLLPPVVCAATVPLGVGVAATSLAAQAAGGFLDAGTAVRALLAPEALAGIAGATALAVIVSFLLERAWAGYQETSSALGYAAACASALVLSAAALCLAHPMEITSPSVVQLATGAAVAALSSIIVGICVFSLGYRKDPEGDRS